MKRLRPVYFVSIVMFIALLLAGANAYAQSPMNQAKIVKVSAHDFKDVVILFLDGNVTSEEGCTRQDAVALDKKDVRYKELFVLGLTAFYMNKTVWGWTNECYRVGDPNLGMPFLTRLDVMR